MSMSDKLGLQTSISFCPGLRRLLARLVLLVFREGKEDIGMLDGWSHGSGK